MSVRKLIQLWFLIILLGLSFMGSMLVYSIICSAIGIIFISNILAQRGDAKEKAAYIMIHIMLYVLQIVTYDTLNRSLLNEAITGVLLLLSFFVGMYFVTRMENVDFNKFDRANLSLSDFRLIKQEFKEAISLVKDSRGKVNITTIQEIMKDIPRHSSFEYINKDSLSETYFDYANKSLEDLAIYIVCSDTGSAASSLISLFTRKVYNHCSISFDKDLKTLISYNGGEKIYPPGLNAEMIEWLFKKKESSILIYKLNVTREQKQKMIDKVKQINREGSAYNLIGLVSNTSFRPNILYCAQFVYKLLECGDAIYFQKKKNKLYPTDFIECDYERKLCFVEKISFQ